MTPAIHPRPRFLPMTAMATTTPVMMTDKMTTVTPATEALTPMTRTTMDSRVSIRPMRRSFAALPPTSTA